MRVTRVEIRGLPGVEPFTVDGFDPGVNIISGPNAVGKSSVLRALRYLLSKPVKWDPPVHLVADLVDSQSSVWQVTRVGTTVEWRRDGAASTPPRLPAPEHLRSYLVTLENLLAADEGDAAFASEVAKGLRGGYDIAALRGLGEFAVGPKVGMKEANHLKSARTDLSRIEAEYRDLVAQEGRIEALERDRLRAETRAALARHIDSAIQLCDARDQREKSRSALSTFPEAMEGLHGDEVDDLRELQRQRSERQVQRGPLMGRRKRTYEPCVDSPFLTALRRSRRSTRVLLGSRRRNWSPSAWTGCVGNA